MYNIQHSVEKSGVVATTWCGNAGCTINLSNASSAASTPNSNNSNSSSNNNNNSIHYDGNDLFLVAHTSGNIYVYNKNFTEEQQLTQSNSILVASSPSAPNANSSNEKESNDEYV